MDQDGVPPRRESGVRRPSGLRRTGRERLPARAPGFRTQRRKRWAWGGSSRTSLHVVALVLKVGS